MRFPDKPMLEYQAGVTVVYVYKIILYIYNTICRTSVCRVQFVFITHACTR